MDVVIDYFKDRYAVIELNVIVQEKRLTKGCPQGSVLGPTLWIVLFDSFLRLRLPPGCQLYAYADDGLLSVEATSRIELEINATEACDKIFDWCVENKLQLSVGKTKSMLLRKDKTKYGKAGKKPKSQRPHA